MTTAVIAVIVTVWILLCALFITAACVLSARLHDSASEVGEHGTGAWSRQDHEIPTTPLG